MGRRGLWKAIGVTFNRSLYAFRRNRIPQRVEPTPRPQLTFLTILALVVAVLFRLLGGRPAYQGNADLWKEQSIYQIVTDRFAVAGDKTTPCNVMERKYCGGNWQGIIEKLDYIQHMGFTAIWISPVVKNIPNDWTKGSGESYHGYWTQDLYSLNANFGNESDLRALSDALHARNMLLMVDVSPNHMGSGPISQITYKDYNPWNDVRYFHPPRLGITYEPPNQTQIEQYWIGVDQVALPDVNTELPEVYNTLSRWIRELVKRYSIDGLRLDTVKHIRKSFWPGFCKASGVFGLGEVLSGDPEYLGPYQNFVPGLLDYVTYYHALRAFTRPLEMKQLYWSLVKLPENVVDVSLLGRFIENHDQPRFAGLTTDTGLRQSAFVFNILGDGIPVVYYGQEMFLTGGNDPKNREALWDHGYSGNDIFKTLNKLRSIAISQDRGYTTTLAKYLYYDDVQLFYQKGAILVGLNGNGAERKISPYVMPIRGTGYTDGEALIEVVGCGTTIAGRGQVMAMMKNGAPVVYYPKRHLVGSGICGL